MVNQNLVNYIRDNLRKGYSLDSLRNALINEGWDPNEVDEAIDIIQTLQPPAPWPEQIPPPPPRSVPLEPRTQPSRAPARPEEEAPTEKQKPSRPIGVTIICILTLLGAIMVLFVGLISVGLAGIIGDISLPGMFGNETASITIEGIGSLLTILGFAFIIMGVFELVGFYLLWKMKRSGWILITVLGLVQIIGYLSTSMISFSITMDIVSVIIFWVIIIGYLFAKRKLFV